MTTPEATKKRRPPNKVILRDGIPVPSTPEGELFNYSPDEVAQWVALSSRELRERAYRREIEHVNNGRQIWFTGLNIRALIDQLTVKPLPPGKRPSAA